MHTEVGNERRERLWSLVEVIRASAPEGSGALHFGGAPLGGAVLFDVGRVCWAAAPGAGRRLTDLVCTDGGVSKQAIDETYAECRQRGTPFGELLVDRKLITPERLRELLLRQTSETLVALSDLDEDPVWIPHRGGGYQARFTFTIPEVVASVTATGLRLDPVKARAELERLVDPSGVAAAFDLGGHPLPFAIGAGVEDYEVLHGLGGWVASTLASWPSRKETQFVVADAGGQGLVAWRAGAVTFGASFQGAQGVARVLTHLMRRT